ncbi:unnamed protein product [Prunus armeniaca]
MSNQQNLKVLPDTWPMPSCALHGSLGSTPHPTLMEGKSLKKLFILVSFFYCFFSPLFSFTLCLSLEGNFVFSISLAGDFGFDPLGLGEDPESLRWYVQAELVHARFAMLGVAGILLTDLLRVTGLLSIPVWYKAGAVKFGFANTETLFLVQLILMGFVETKRYMDFKSPGSQAQDGSFFGLEAALEGLEPGYPGGPLLNPLGLAKDIKNAHEWKLKEIKNGRLAMVAMLGIFVQASITHVGPIDNLVDHLSNPWHRTIVQTLANSAS